jgi:hypothetical protein
MNDHNNNFDQLSKIIVGIYKLLKTMFMVFISFVIISGATLSIGSYALIKCNGINSSICDSISTIKKRCLQNDLNAIIELLTLGYQSSAEENFKDNTVNPSSPNGAVYYKGPLNCGVQGKQRELNNLANMQSTIDKACQSLILPATTNTINQDEVLESCNQACENNGVIDGLCDPDELPDQLDLELAITEESPEGQDIFNELANTLSELPDRYYQYFIATPLDKIKEALSKCYIDVICLADKIVGIIEEIKSTFSQFFKGILQGLGNKFKEEIESLFDMGKLFSGIIDHFKQVLSNAGSYLSSDKYFGAIPKGIDFNKLLSDLFEPITTIGESFKKFLDRGFWSSMIYSNVSELLDSLNTPIPEQLLYLGTRTGYLLGEGVSIGASTLLTAISGGAASATLATKLSLIATKLATRIPAIKRTFNVLEIAVKKGYTIYNDIKLNLSKLPSGKIATKAKDIKSKISSIKDKGYSIANQVATKLTNLIPNPTLKQRVITTIQNKVDDVACVVNRAKYNLTSVGNNNRSDLATTTIINPQPNQSFNPFNILTINAQAQEPTNYAINNTQQQLIQDNTITPHGCVNIQEAPEQPEFEVLFNKDSSKKYREKFVVGFRSMVSREDQGKITKDFKKDDIIEMIQDSDINHRIPSGYLKDKDELKKYLYSNNINDINSPLATEALSKTLNRVTHNNLWRDCTSTKSKDRKLNVTQISECLEQVECKLQYKNQVQEDDQYLRYVLGRLKTSCNNNYKTHYINNK